MNPIGRIRWRTSDIQVAVPCRAFTQIEALVSLAIVGLLLALALNSLATARETSRRAQCQNNLKQLAIASHTFHDSFGYLPPQNATSIAGAGEERRKPPGVISAWGQLLPYLGRGDVYSALDLHEFGELNHREPPGSSKNSHLLFMKLDGLICPSETSGLGRNNYRVSLGTAPFPPYRKRGGAYSSIFWGNRATFAMITDGLSQTTLISERLVGDFNAQRFDPRRDIGFIKDYPLWIGGASSEDGFREMCNTPAALDSSRHGSYLGATWLLNGYAWIWYNHVDGPNSRIPDCDFTYVPALTGKISASSLHPRGVNVAMADASVRFVHDDIELGVWRALGTRAGSEVVAPF
jgi:prepilin-type processing-associated H-X9-DG protein